MLSRRFQRQCHCDNSNIWRCEAGSCQHNVLASTRDIAVDGYIFYKFQILLVRLMWMRPYAAGWRKQTVITAPLKVMTVVLPVVPFVPDMCWSRSVAGIRHQLECNSLHSFHFDYLFIPVLLPDKLTFSRREKTATNCWLLSHFY